MKVDELFAKLAKINIKNVPTNKLGSYIFTEISNTYRVIQTEPRLNGQLHFISEIGYVNVIISNRYVHVYFLALGSSRVLILSDDGFTLIDAEKPPTHGIKRIPTISESRKSIICGGVSGNLHKIDNNIECVDIRKWPQKLIEYLTYKFSEEPIIIYRGDAYMVIGRSMTHHYVGDKVYECNKH